MRGIGIVTLVLLLVPSPARADSLSDAAQLLKSDEREERLEGIRMLVRLDTPSAVRMLEGAIRNTVADLDRMSGKLDRLLDAHLDLLPRLRWIVRQYEAGKDMDDEARRTLDRMDKLEHALAAAQVEAQGMLDALEQSGAALAKFRNEEAWECVEEGAGSEANPLLRQFYMQALGDSERSESVAILCGLASYKDPRIRAGAVRSLIPQVAKDGVIEAVRARAEDEHWAVRLAAMKVMAGAPLPDAVEYLVGAAVREEGELAATANDYLDALLGVSFPQDPGHWAEWWKKNGEAVKAGTWSPPVDAGSRERPPTVASFFRIPIVSHRIVFVLDFSGSMSEPFLVKDPGIAALMAEHELPATRLGYAQAEFIRAITAMPDGAYFNVLGYSVDASAFSRRLVELKRSTRRRAIRWVKRLETDDLTNVFAALEKVYNDYLDVARGARRFEHLPDTVIFLTDGIATRGRFQETDPLLTSVRLWNRPVGMVFHCVGIGEGHDDTLLRTLARRTGGYYVDVTKGLRALKPRKRTLPLGARRGRGKLVATEAKLKALLADLDGFDSEKQIAACRKLAEKGPAAAFAAGNLADLLDDFDPLVQDAAVNALVRIGAGAVPALKKTLESTDDADAVANAATVLGLIGKPAAAGAVEALERHEDHWDSRAKKKVQSALAALQ